MYWKASIKARTWWSNSKVFFALSTHIVYAKFFEVSVWDFYWIISIGLIMFLLLNELPVVLKLLPVLPKKLP